MRIRSRYALAAGIVAVALGVFAGAAAAAAPQNTAAPTIAGTAKEGSTLTAQDGSWSNSPTSFTYQWQRCASDGTGCGDITSATSKTYTASSGDVGHTLRVAVTAVNTDGKTSATSGATDVVDSKNGPASTVKPAVTGSAVVGQSLTVSNGSWSTAPTSYARQWQRCSGDGTGCLNSAGATGQTYGVRSDDVGHRLRALVTARTASGSTTVATNASAVVTATTNTVTNTSTVTTTVPGNKAPRVSFLSLRVHGARAYGRFRVCDDRAGRLTILQRDNKARVLSVARRWHVAQTSCAVYGRSWHLKSAFRTHGRYVATVRAIDAQGRLSLLRSRSLYFQ